MYTFNPGPSQLYPKVDQFLQQAVASGILSNSHRSTAFKELYTQVINGLRNKLNVPDNYQPLFFSSATECWSVLAEGMISQNAHHVYNGAFGERAYRYSKYIHKQVTGHLFEDNTPFSEVQAEVLKPVEMLCLTHNETSKGHQIQPSYLQGIRAVLQEQIIAIDSTSSMAGQALPWQAADVWYASVQKCFGMPAGLGVMLVGPYAQKRIERIGNNGHYNGLLRLLEQGRSMQTSFTPNVLALYLLAHILEDMPDIAATDQLIKQRAAAYYAILEEHPILSPYLTTIENRSQTVICVSCPTDRLASIKEAAKAEGLILGNGYQPLKETTFRIANFPALPTEAVNKLVSFLSSWY